MVTGLGTAHSHPYYKKFFQAEMKYAWPDEEGDIRGLMIEPLLLMCLMQPEKMSCYISCSPALITYGKAK
jgi:hypothetical protein